MSDKSLIFIPSNENSVKMLATLGVKADIKYIEVNLDLKKKETPVKYIDRITKEKSDIAWQEGQIVLSAHIAVFVGRRLIKIPQNDQEIRTILNLYSGRNHVVYTAVCLKKPDGKASIRRTFTRIKVRNIDSHAIDEFVGSNEWINQIGGYNPIGIMQKHIIKTTGSYSGFSGLPCYEVANLINQI